MGFVTSRTDNRRLLWARIALIGFALLWLLAGWAWLQQSLTMAYVLDETPKFTTMSRDLVDRLRDFRLSEFDIVLFVPPAVCFPSAFLSLIGVPEQYAYFIVQACLILSLAWGCERIGTFLHGPRCGVICAAVALSCPILNSSLRLFTPDVMAGAAMMWEFYAFLRLRAGGGRRYQLLFGAMMLLLLNKGTATLYSLVLWAYIAVVWFRHARSQGEFAWRTWNVWEWFCTLSGLCLLVEGLLFGLRVVTVIIWALLLLGVVVYQRRRLRISAQCLAYLNLVLAVAGVYLYYWITKQGLIEYFVMNSTVDVIPEGISIVGALYRLFVDFLDQICNEALFPHIAVLFFCGITTALVRPHWGPVREMFWLIVVPGPALNLLVFNYVTPRFIPTWWGAAAVIIGVFLSKVWRPLGELALAGLVSFQLILAGGWTLGLGIPPANDAYMNTDYFMCGRYHLEPNSHHPDGAGLAWLLHEFRGHHHWAETYICSLYPYRNIDAEKLLRCWQEWDCADLCREGGTLVCTMSSPLEFHSEVMLIYNPATAKELCESSYEMHSLCSLEVARKWCLASYHQGYNRVIVCMDIPPVTPVSQQRQQAEEVVRSMGPKLEVVRFSPSKEGENALVLAINHVPIEVTPWRKLTKREAEQKMISFPIDGYYSERRLRGRRPISSIKF